MQETRGEAYNFYSFLTLALDGVSGQRHALAAPYPREKTPPVPTGQEAGWASELAWTQRLEEKSFASTGDWTPIVQSLVRRYTDWATPAPVVTCNFSKRTQSLSLTLKKHHIKYKPFFTTQSVKEGNVFN
jgi:hypothetical protein